MGYTIKTCLEIVHLGYNKKVSKVKRVIGQVFKVFPFAALGYIVYRFLQIDVDYSILLENKMQLFYLALVVVLYIVSINLTAFNFVYVLKHVSGANVPFRKIIGVYITANLYKYLPGNVLHYVGRNTLANSYGIPHKDIAFSSFFEAAGNVTLVVVLSLGFAGPYAVKLLALVYSRKPVVIFGVLSVVLLLIAGGIIIYARSSRAKYLVQRLFHSSMSKMWLVAAGIFSFNYLINGLSYYLLLQNLGGGLSGNQILTVMAAYNIAWLAGFITPGAPGGIGVKEFVLIFILGSIAPESALLLSVALHRVALIVADVLTYLFRKVFV
jgi:uncharacterized membrane protein YbhN (UPF0104 family)